MDGLPSCRGHVINLARREGKRRRMAQLLRGSGLEFNFFEAVDGAARMSVSAAEFAPPWYRLDANSIRGAIPSLPADHAGALLDYCRDLTPGEVGCASSHAALWASAASDVATSVHVIMEDDLGRFDPGRFREFLRGCAALERNDVQWDIIYLYRDTNTPRNRFGSVGATDARIARTGFLRVEEPSSCAAAYAISSAGARKLCSAQLANRGNIVAVDDFLSAATCPRFWRKDIGDHARQLLGQHWPLVALDYAPLGGSRVTGAPDTAISDTEPMRT